MFLVLLALQTILSLFVEDVEFFECAELVKVLLRHLLFLYHEVGLPVELLRILWIEQLQAPLDDGDAIDIDEGLLGVEPLELLRIVIHHGLLCSCLARSSHPLPLRPYRFRTFTLLSFAAPFFC